MQTIAPIDVDRIFDDLSEAYREKTPWQIKPLAPIELATVEDPQLVETLDMVSPGLVTALRRLKEKVPEFNYRIAAKPRKADSSKSDSHIIITTSLPIFEAPPLESQPLKLFVYFENFEPCWIKAGQIFIPENGVHIPDTTTSRYAAGHAGKMGALTAIVRGMFQRGWVTRPPSPHQGAGMMTITGDQLLL